MVIDRTLSRQAAEALFEEEAILFGESNAVPEFRIVEIFGEWAGTFIEKHTHYKGYFEGGRDYNGWGDCSHERPMLNYLYRRGFLKIVSEHNYRLSLRAHRSSAAGEVVDRIWRIRQEAMDAADREAAQNKSERKAKRKNAQGAKAEIQEVQR